MRSTYKYLILIAALGLTFLLGPLLVYAQETVPMDFKYRKHWEETSDGGQRLKKGSLSVGTANLSAVHDESYVFADTVVDGTGKIVASRTYQSTDGWATKTYTNDAIVNRLGAPELDAVDYLPYTITHADSQYLYGYESWQDPIRLAYSGGDYVKTSLVDFSGISSPADGTDLTIRTVYSGEALSDGLVIFQVEDASTDQSYLYASTDYGATLANDNDPVLIIGCTDCTENGSDGTVGNQTSLVQILNHGFETITIDGTPHIVAGEYNVNGSENDVRLWKTSDGITWTEVAHWNTGGTQYIRHIHTIRKDPYNSNYAVIACGDTDDESGLIYWDTNEDLPSEQYPSEYTGTAAVGIGGRQRYRAVSTLFDSNYIYWIADATSAGEIGIWRVARSMDKGTLRKLNAVYDKLDGSTGTDVYSSMGYYGLKLSDGTMLFSTMGQAANTNGVTVTAATDNFAATDHGYSTGDMLQLYGTALPTGVPDSNSNDVSDTVFCIKVDADNFKIAYTELLAENGIAIDITSTGTSVTAAFNEPYTPFWTSSTNNRLLWGDVARIWGCTDATTTSTPDSFRLTGLLEWDVTGYAYASGGFGGKEDSSLYHTAIFESTGNAFLRRHPRTLHPVLWVETDGNDSTNDGYRPGTPLRTFRATMINGAVVGGTRVKFGTGTFSESSTVNPSVRNNDRPTSGPITIEGEGYDSTTIRQTDQAYTVYHDGGEPKFIYENLRIENTHDGTGERVFQPLAGADIDIVKSWVGNDRATGTMYCFYLSGGITRVLDGSVLYGDENTQYLLFYASSGDPVAYIINSIGDTAGTGAVYYRSTNSECYLYHNYIGNPSDRIFDRRAGTDNDPVLQGNVFQSQSLTYNDEASSTEDDDTLNYNVYNAPHTAANVDGGDSASKGNADCPGDELAPYDASQCFVDADSGDYTPKSPLINVIPGRLNSIGYDMNFKQRPLSGYSDVGPVEYGIDPRTTLKSVVSVGQ